MSRANRTILERFLSSVRKRILYLRWRKKFIVGKQVQILGSIPILKVPANGKIIVGDEVVLNSDFVNSNTALTTKVKFVTGINGKIRIGNNCDLNGTCMIAYDEIEIGDFCQFASSSLISDTDFHPVNPEARITQMLGMPFSYDLVNKKKVKIGHNVWVG
jgi:acetyltransferase-like isoleucine patch superfamily enzyme